MERGTPTSGLGFEMPVKRVRVMPRAPFLIGNIGQLDTRIIDEDTSNMRVAESTSGLATFVYGEPTGTANARIYGVAAEDLEDNQLGYANLRGIMQVYLGGSGSAGDPIRFGTLDNGSRYIGIALEDWSASGLVRAMFDGERGFGVYFEEVDPENNPPNVTITSPPTHLWIIEVGTQVTFTGTASDIEDGDLSSTIDWTELDSGGQVTILATNDNSFNKTYNNAGSYLVTAMVTDSGDLSDTDQVLIVVTEVGGGHEPPDSTSGYQGTQGEIIFVSND